MSHKMLGSGTGQILIIFVTSLQIYQKQKDRKTENSWLLVPYLTKANHFCELYGPYVCLFCLLSSQKQLAFIDYDSRSQEFSVFLFLIDL